MNKQDLINQVAEDAELTKAQAKAAVEAVFGNIHKALRDSGEAAFVGFGTFKVTHRAARTGRNPQTGAPLEIAASNSVAFKVSKVIKDTLN